MKIFKQKLEAFTLIESLVSIAIILIAATAPLTLTFNAITTTIYNKNRLVASYLASQTVEDLRAFRDGFSIACTDLQVSYTGDEGAISGATCNKGVISPLSVPGALLTSGTPPPNQEIAWDLFLNAIGFTGSQTTLSGPCTDGGSLSGLCIDEGSFDYNGLRSINTYPSCLITLDPNKGYSCGISGDYTGFSKVVTLTKVNDSSLKVQVTVTYARSKLLGLGAKSVNIVDYIYER